MTPRVSEVRTLAATDHQVLIEVRAPKRRPVETCYDYASIPAFPGEGAVEFRKPDGTVYHVRYGVRIVPTCDCPGGSASDMAGKAVCKHCIAVLDLINAEMLPAA